LGVNIRFRVVREMGAKACKKALIAEQPALHWPVRRAALLMI